jgi:hypothetical protein
LENGYVNTDLSAALKEEREIMKDSKDIEEISEDDKDEMRSLLKDLF